VAKNLILAGPKQVTIYDPRIVSVEDIGRNFYCRPEHVGKISRAEASLDQLKDLNPNVHVQIANDDSVELMYLLSNIVPQVLSVLWYLIATIVTISLSSTKLPITKGEAFCMLATSDFMASHLLILEKLTAFSMLLENRQN